MEISMSAMKQSETVDEATGLIRYGNNENVQGLVETQVTVLLLDHARRVLEVSALLVAFILYF